MHHDDLTGIWTFTARDIQQDGYWLLRLASILVESLHLKLTGTAVSLKSGGRSLGFNTYPCHLAGDLAQCLRFARNEADMDIEYYKQIKLNLAFILNTRAIDLRSVIGSLPGDIQPPDPSLDCIADSKWSTILDAAQARFQLNDNKPLSGDHAAALTGWNPKELSVWKDENGKLTSKKTGNIKHFNIEPLKRALEVIEDAFFNSNYYKPL